MKKIKKSLSLLFVCVLALSLSCSWKVFAAVSLPAISSSKPITCYTMNASGRVYAYTSSALREKTGGYIDCAADECKILKVSGNAVQVKYPVSGGTRTAWFARSAFSSCNIAGGALEKWTQGNEITTYRRSDGRTKFGSISAGDVCYKLAVSGNYTQAVYPISGGYKMGWIKTSEMGKTTGTNLSYALYHSKDAFISCGFDAYKTQRGRHEGIDIIYKTDKPVYALTSGVVTAAVKGRTGGNGLSTLAVYNEDDNKTVVYLHMTIGSFSVGDTIKTGQKIGSQSWRGISSAGDAHTHVEVRDGKKSAAAKSVGDNTLDNPNPKDFWQSKGYIIK